MAAPDLGSPGRGIAIGFIAGAVSALTFHAFMWWIFYLLGMQAIPPYPMRGNMIGVPPLLRGAAINWDILAWLRAVIIDGVWGIGTAIIASVAASRAGQRSTA